MDTKLNVAIYCRLSREDGDSIESSSINILEMNSNLTRI